MRGFIVYAGYRLEDGSPVIELYGRLENRESFLARISGFRPYFFIRKKDVRKAGKLLPLEFKGCSLRNFDSEEVAITGLESPKDVVQARKVLQDAGIISYESDIRFVQRYYIDKGILGTIELKGDFSSGDRTDRVYEDPIIRPVDPYEVKLKVLSLDIETDREAKKIYSIALYGEGIQEVHLVSRKKARKAVSYENEEFMLKGFARRMIEIDPDIIVGWSVVNFDLRLILSRMRRHKIPARIGRGDEEMRVRVQKDFFRESTADIPGRIVFDGISLLRQAYLKFDSYKLDHVAKEILGDRKIQNPDDFFEKLPETIMKDPGRIAKYNLKDSKLVLDILNKKKIVELNITKALITGLQLDRVKGSVAALDSLYIRKARKRGFVVPNSGYKEREERLKGAYVMSPEPGIYDNVAVLDFKSLYPSIIRTYNIDPLSLKEDGEIIAPNGARFENSEGILPEIIAAAWKQRDLAKKEKDEVRTYAIKIIMNSFYGVLANPHCRFYSPLMGNAITSFARETIKTTAGLIEKMGYKVLYGDTDSVFVDFDASSAEQAKKDAQRVTKEINSHFRKEVKQKYNRESYLELEFDKLFKVLMLPKVRGGPGGAKKRYAGLLDEGTIKVVGMETVRRDWTEIAKLVQQELLERVFHKKEVAAYIRRIVSEIRAGKHDDKLIYRKAIRKGLKEYTKTTPPHVRAARMLDKISSNVIEYCITVNGPEPVEKLKSAIDYDHYIEKQVKPIAQSILELYGQSFDDTIRNSRQKSLFGY